MTNKTASDKLGTMDIRSLIITMSVPMMISMMVQAIYNIVDSYYVSHISEAALTAVSMSFPIQGFKIAASVGTGVGMNALLSRALGAKDKKYANKIAHNALILMFMWYSLFLIFGIFFTEAFFERQGASGEILMHGKAYLSIISTFSIFQFIQIYNERLLQATGLPMLSMLSQAVGAITNIILDPIFIFGYLGVPAMGAKGAAIATILGQTTGMAVSFLFNKYKNQDINYKFLGIEFDSSVIKEILKVGLPTTVMQSVGSVMGYLFNQILLTFTSTAVAVFGIYFKVQSFVFMPVFGLNNGTVPIMAYNYGAKNKDRIIETYKKAALYASIVMVLGLLIMQLFAANIMSIFNANDEMMHIGVSALRRISLCFVFVGFSIATSGMFQALGKSMYSLIISSIRQIGILIPVAYLISKRGVLNDVWWAFLIAEFCSFFVVLFFLKEIKKGVLDKID
ncbi:MAG: MATE family efflux transporter [Tissierellia bacterium]|nr:MATE family efflux transporter [Tissierellia bacterium]